MPDDTPRASEAYKDIRSLARGIALLKCMNQMPGGTATTTELGQMTQVHRTTVKRMLETLRTCGLVRPTEQEGQYCLTFEVKRLSEGFIEDEWISQVATPLMRGAVKQLMWPCDLATMEAGFLVVRESTHRFSLLSQHQAMIGERLPLFVTAIGRAYLAACDAEQLGSILQLLGQRPDWIGDMARDRKGIDTLLQATRARGYARNSGEWAKESDFSAIGVAVMGTDQVIGAINMIYPNASVDEQTVERKYLPLLQKLAYRIGRDSTPWRE